MDKGEQGIEVELGMLGDLGSVTDTRKSAAIEAQPIEASEISKEATTAQPILPESVQKPSQESEPPVELRQTAEIRVKKVDREIAAPVSADPVEIIETEIRKIPSQIVKTMTDQVIDPLQASLAKSAVATDPRTKNELSTLKMSTGSANALTSGGTPGYKRSYYALIAVTLAKHKRYPKYARTKGQEGTVLLSFTVLSSGLVKNIKIKQSSGYRQLDRAVKKMVKEASPLPPFPAQQSEQEIIITIPIVFKLNQ